MKKVILAATVVAASASASFAGTYGDETVIAPEVFVEEASSSSGSFGSLGGNAALIALGAAAVAIALSSDSDTTTGE